MPTLLFDQLDLVAQNSLQDSFEEITHMDEQLTNITQNSKSTKKMPNKAHTIYRTEALNIPLPGTA